MTLRKGSVAEKEANQAHSNLRKLACRYFMFLQSSLQYVFIDFPIPWMKSVKFLLLSAEFCCVICCVSGFWLLFIITVMLLMWCVLIHAPNSHFITVSVIVEMHQEARRHHLKWLSDSLKRVTEEEEEADRDGSRSSCLKWERLAERRC